jgi:phage tail sheath protein FI
MVQVRQNNVVSTVSVTALTTDMTLNQDLPGVTGATKDTKLTTGDGLIPAIQEYYWSIIQQNALVHAVYGFFNNGGTRCWVTRIAQATTGDGSPDNAKTNTNLKQALTTFRPIDEIAIVAIPGAQDKAVQDALLDHCEQSLLPDRFAILDGQQHPSALTKADIGKSVRNSSYGALYYPWIRVADPATGTTIAVPPSGHIAGVYARTDATRGVHKAPANAVIRGALDVERLLSKRDQGTQWVVFEPNEPGLWAKITRNITAFLTNVWRAGALFGTTPQEAFYVKCDAETNPPEVRDQGQVVTEIGVAIVKPAEFVIFRLSQWAGPGR